MNETTLTQPKSPNRTILKHGLITGGLLILFTLLVYALDLMQNKAIGIVSIFLLIGGMYLGTKSLRDQAYGGLMTYGKAFSTSFLIGLTASGVLAIFTFLFYKFFDPGMVEIIVERAEEAMLESRPDLSDEQLEMAMKMTRSMTQPGPLAVMSLITNAVASVVIGLILAIFLKREDPFASNIN